MHTKEKLQIVVKLLLLLLLVSNLERLESHVVKYEAETPLTEAAIHVIERFISTKTNNLVIMENCHPCAGQQRSYHSRLMTYMLRNLNSSISFQLYLGESSRYHGDYNVFIVDSVAAFSQLRFNFADTLHDREFYFLVLFTMRDMSLEMLTMSMHKIFLNCLHFKVLNAVLMLEEQASIHFYSYKLFGPKCDEEITMYRFNHWHRQKLQHDMLFPPRFHSLYNCPLNVRWYLLPPFVMFNGDPYNATHLLDETRLDGIDGAMLRILAHVLEFRIRLMPPCDGNFVVDARNMTGCFDELRQGNADIAIGALSGSHLMRHYLSTSVAYHQSALVFVVRIDPFYGPISHMIKPFRNLVWFVTLVTFAFGVLLQKAFSYKGGQLTKLVISRRDQLLNMLATFIGNPLHTLSLPHNNNARFLLTCWLLATLVLRSAYQGKLYDVFRKPCYTALPADINELIDRNYMLLAPDYFDFYPRNYTTVIKTNLSSCFTQLENALDASVTTVALVGSLAHHNQLNWETTRLTYVREPIYLYQLVLYLRKHSVLKFALDRKLKQLMNAGITSYINRHFELQKLKYLENHWEHRVTPISMNMLCGLITIYFMLLGVAFVIFSTEILRARVRVQKLQGQQSD